MTTRLEQVSEPELQHGESPVWFESDGRLALVDLLRGDVVSLSADGGLIRRNVGTIATIIRPRSGGGSLVALENTIAATRGDLFDGSLCEFRT